MNRQDRRSQGVAASAFMSPLHSGMSLPRCAGQPVDSSTSVLTVRPNYLPPAHLAAAAGLGVGVRAAGPLGGTAQRKGFVQCFRLVLCALGQIHETGVACRPQRNGGRLAS